LGWQFVAYAQTRRPGRGALTGAKFWSHWRELRDGRQADITAEVAAIVNRPLTKAQKDRLFADRFGYVRAYFEELEDEGREVTEQDKALYCLCRPERLMDLASRFAGFLDSAVRS
jgi:type I restriction enzyme, R subunit